MINLTSAVCLERMSLSVSSYQLATARTTHESGTPPDPPSCCSQAARVEHSLQVVEEGRGTAAGKEWCLRSPATLPCFGLPVMKKSGAWK